MLQRQPQESPQQPKETPVFTPSDTFYRLQTYSDLFFLSACACGGILVVNAAKISPVYFSLIVGVAIAAIATLAFFPNADNVTVRRIGIVAVAIGLLLGNWESIAQFKFQPIHGAIGIGIVLLAVVVLGAIGAIGGSRE